MKIIIVGCGITGQSILSSLEMEGHDIVAIDSNESCLEKVNNLYDVKTVQGNGADVSVLEEAGTKTADLLIAITPTDEQNLLCAMTARKMGVKNTIARIRNPEYEGQLSMFKEELGLSMYINPERVFSYEVSRLLKFPSAFNVETFAKGQVELLGIKLENNKLVGTSLFEMNKKINLDVLVCAVKREEKIIIPRGDFTLKKGDMIYVTASSKTMHAFVKSIGALGQRTRKVLILGGGIDSYYIARQLSDAGIDIKIIEPNRERCEYLLDNIPHISVATGNVADTDLLIEEGIDEVDAIVCLTGSDEINTMLALFAKKRNPGIKTIARYDSSFTKVLMESAGITDAVSPKNVASNLISRYVRAKSDVSGSGVITLYKLLDGELEALEFAVNDNKIIGKPLKDLKIKRGILVATVVRKNEIIIAKGDTALEKGDSVIVITTNTMLDSLEDILA